MGRIDFDGFAWTDLEQPSRDDVFQLAQKYHLHQLNVEDCFSTRQVSKIDVHEEYSFIILRFPVISASVIGETKPVSVIQLSVFIGQDFLVTVHKDSLKPLSQLFQSRGVGDPALVHDTETKSPTHLLHKIIHGLASELLTGMVTIDQDLDIIEDQVVRGKLHDRRDITDLRIEIATLTRLVVPLRRVFMETASDVKRFAKGESLAPYYSDIRDHFDKILEELQAAKDSIEIYNDTAYVAGTEKSNKILGLLTILFTLTIPVTVLSSFYGMNIEIPGTVQSGPWTFLGPYTTLILVIIESVVPAVIMMWYFYHKKWTQI